MVIPPNVVIILVFWPIFVCLIDETNRKNKMLGLFLKWCSHSLPLSFKDAGDPPVVSGHGPWMNPPPRRNNNQLVADLCDSMLSTKCCGIVAINSYFGFFNPTVLLVNPCWSNCLCCVEWLLCDDYYLLHVIPARGISRGMLALWLSDLSVPSAARCKASWRKMYPTCIGKLGESRWCCSRCTKCLSGINRQRTRIRMF